MTLIELIVFIIIVSVALAGVLAALNVSARGSADPLPPKQALAIADALLEEVLLKSYGDPDGTNAGESRSSFDNVTDYDTPDDATATAITTDLTGALLPAGYGASIEISSAALGPAAVAAWQVTVSVTYNSAGDAVSLTGYRANY